jgi:metal-dependent HD superfamily phosphatase/phosphodiesterase
LEKAWDKLVDSHERRQPLQVEEIATASEAAPVEQPEQEPRIRVPSRHNPRLAEIIERVNGDEELKAIWRCANVNAVDRLGLSDHGWVHIQIVANVGLKLLRLLLDAGIRPSIVVNHGLSNEDAEVVVVLGALLHDLGMAIHRDRHEEMSPFLALPKLKELLSGSYDTEQQTIVTAETLHAIVAHRWDARCLTIEAGVVKVADALDMAKGRSRIPFEAGSVNIHSVSALAVEGVTLSKGESRPIGVEVILSNSAGIFQLDELLKRKLRNSSIADYVEVTAQITGESESRLVPVYRL